MKIAFKNIILPYEQSKILREILSEFKIVFIETDNYRDNIFSTLVKFQDENDIDPTWNLFREKIQIIFKD